MWWYYAILDLFTHEVIGSDKVWAKTREDAQQEANYRCGLKGHLAGGVVELNQK